MNKLYHFIGIGGIGMSALASILLQKGAKVSGSDVKDSPIVDKLKKEGAIVHMGHAAEHIPQESVVVYSSGIHKDNPELMHASSSHSRLIHRSELLNELAEGKQLIGIAGTHGKTTTTALLIHVYRMLGKSPSFAVGGILNDLNANGQQGEGDAFIAELDESDASFLSSTPDAVCITNIDSDHLNHWKDLPSLKKAFELFLSKVRNQSNILWCGDSISLRKLHPKGLSFGFGSDCDVRATHYQQQGLVLQMDVECAGIKLSNLQVPLMGTHNALNTLAVIGQCHVQGLDLEKVKEALKTFPGVKRRAELLYQNELCSVYNDYAHHPAKVSATLHAFKAAHPSRRLVSVFQPHRASRVLHCMGAWGGCFDAADQAYILDVFRFDNEIEQAHSTQIIEECRDSEQMQVEYVPNSFIVDKLVSSVREGDIILFMGAGDLTQYAKKFCEKMSVNSLAHI